MRYRNVFGRIGISVGLLIAGMFSGLTVPVSSDAQTVTFKVDDGAPVTVNLVPAVCPTGYNQCYYFNPFPVATGSGGRQFQLQPYSTTTAPKVLIGDFVAQDAFKITSFKVVPYPSAVGWSGTESHVVKITATHTFNANPNGAGNYVVALRSGGYLLGGGSPFTVFGDNVRFEGTGTFNPVDGEVPLLNDVNPNPLEIQVANTTSAAFFTLNQVITYPTFNCDADGAEGAGTECTPIVELTMTGTLFGPDTIIVTDSNDGLGGGPCNLDNGKGGAGGSPGGNPAIPCHSNTKKKSEDDTISAAFDLFNTTDEQMAADDGVTERARQCTEADNCPCADPYDDTCKGQIIHVVRNTPPRAEAFEFIATGSGLNPTGEVYTIETDDNGDGSNTLGPLPAVGGGPWKIKGSDDFTSVGHQIDQWHCVSEKEPAVPMPADNEGFTRWETVIDPVTSDRILIVHEMAGGDTLTCTSHVH